MRPSVPALLAAALALAAASPGAAQTKPAGTQDAPAWAVGTNLMSCRSWIANRPGAAQIEPLQRIAPLDWLYGYVVGQSAALHLDLLAGLHPSDVGDWVDIYCQSHREDDIQQASAALTADLIAAARKK